MQEEWKAASKPTEVELGEVPMLKTLQLSACISFCMLTNGVTSGGNRSPEEFTKHGC